MEAQHERRARRKAQIRDTMKEEARRRRKPLPDPAAAAAKGNQALDQPGETREDAAYRTERVDKPTSQGGLLSPPKGQQESSISLREIHAAGLEVKQLQAMVVARVQQLLNSLAGRRGDSEDQNKQIARLVYEVARDSGTDLLCGNQAGDLRWHAAIFEVRTTDSRKLTLKRSADFPQLLAQAKGTGKEPDRTR
jgi:hypothetical protein